MGRVDNLASRAPGKTLDPSTILDPTSVVAGPSHPSIAERTFQSKLPIRQNSRSRSRSTSPIKPPSTSGTIRPRSQTIVEELQSKEHQDGLKNAIANNRSFRSKSSLSPRTAQALETPAARKPLACKPASYSAFKQSRQPPPHIPLPTSKMTETKLDTENVREGMQQGYAMSPMSTLRIKFTKDTDDLSSPFLRASNIASKSALFPHQILDHGFSRSNNMPRFSLTERYEAHISGTIADMQNILKSASDLIPERTTYFKVDPDDLLLSVLQGADDLGQLHVAWTALRKRMEISIKTFEKYDTQYQSLIVPPSPASTAPELYDTMKNLPSKAEKLEYLYSSVPHHAEELKTSEKARLRSRRSGDSIIQPPSRLLSAYPAR